MSKSSSKPKPLSNDVAKILSDLLQKRGGGAINIRGIQYQVLFACYLILERFSDQDGDYTIRLEGIEDVDLLENQIVCPNNTYIQLKSSDNKMNAGDFWGMNVLQNFLQTFLADGSSQFILIYNMKVADGMLTNLINNKHDNKSRHFWHEKISRLAPQGFNVESFLERISFEHYSASQLSTLIVSSLFKHWQVNIGTETQFLRSLFYNVLEWSKKRATINRGDIQTLFTEIRDSYSKAVVNPAIEHNYIAAVSYLPIDGGLDYFEGKSAQPYHIAAGLPARRRIWEKAIEESIASFDVTVIRSSSGQGKSTLAWQMGFNLKDRYTVYQLNMVRSWEDANAISDFIASRLAIGLLPLVVVDGLNSYTEKWPNLVERVAGKGVKFIVTSRHEDWFRYGADVSRADLQIVDINLSMVEAEAVFNQFKSGHKLHPDVRQWQPVWENVREKGLLIEYAYLLTKGEMIIDRLEAQLKTLDRNQGGASKLEILRIVSLADSLALKVSTRSLLKYISDSIGFEHDRNSTLSELEKEYFLNFSGEKIGGLHPVRSKHLVDLLHRTTSVADSMIVLYGILEDSQKADFFANSSAVLTPEGKRDFYVEIANVLKDKTFQEMSLALDGISHAEPQGYWLDNKAVFDEVFETGGLDLFILHTIPGIELDTIETLKGIMGPDRNSGLNFLSEKLKELPTYTFKESGIAFFANELYEALKKRSHKIDSFEGLSSVSLWFQKLNLDFRFIVPFKEELFKNLYDMPFEEATELFRYFYLAEAKPFQKFVERRHKDIVSFLKIRTNSLYIGSRKRNELHTEFLLDMESGQSTNEQAVSRIGTVYTFLPFYKKYSSEGILLPFPSEDIVAVAKSDSCKNMSPEAITDHFALNYNTIWSRTILGNYLASSAFEWQNETIALRKLALAWCKCVVRMTEGMLEGNKGKRDLGIKELGNFKASLAERIRHKKKYPQYGPTRLRNYREHGDEKPIEQWISSLMNINNQLVNLYSPKGDNDRNVAFINLKALYLKTEGMQSSYRSIEKNATSYFDVTPLESEETEWYFRLYITAHYFLDHLPIEMQAPIHVAKNVISKWWQERHTNRLAQLKEILSEAESETGFKFIAPVRIIETDTITYTTFGIENVNFSDQGAFQILSASLAKLSDFPSTFFTVAIIKENEVIGAFRFTKEFFEIIRDYLNGMEGDIEKAAPLPLISVDRLEEVLPGIRQLDPTKMDAGKKAKIEIINELWRLSEYNASLNLKNTYEKEWRERIHKNAKNYVDQRLAIIYPKYDNFINWALKGLSGKLSNEKLHYVRKIFEVMR